MRVGIGYDIHRLVPDRKLVLGGVEIPFDRGLEGHSDADVVVHAIMDALLGAAGSTDIGTHFPPSDERYRDISSLELLDRVGRLLRERRLQIVNIDVVLVAEQPKIGPHVEEMRTRISLALQVPSSVIGIKATTNEGLGAEGRGEGMSAQAVASISER